MMDSAPDQLPQLTPEDCARYTLDMLTSLMQMAHRCEEMVLARLLETAAREAERIAHNRG